MSISDEDLAEALAVARGFEAGEIVRTKSVHAGWLKVARHARELLTPDMQMPPFPGSPGPLQPGDIVSVRGVVKIAPPTPGAGVHVLLDEGCVTALVTPRTVTLIERPAPIEPDWQPGDVAQDENGTRYVYGSGTVGAATRPWLRIVPSPMWVRRDEIPGTLTPCDVVPREGTSRSRNTSSDLI